MEQFVRINEVKYSTDFDFFMRTQVHVIQHLDNTTTFCSQLESVVLEGTQHTLWMTLPLRTVSGKYTAIL